MKKKQVGLLGGTFDPVHLGHLNLAKELFFLKGLEEVWFIPAKQNPFKEEKPLFSEEKRLEMLRKALLETPKFLAVDIELKKTLPSYTIDTVKELQEKYPEAAFSLLIGDDHLKDFHKWKSAKELCDLLPIYIGTRQKSVSIPNSPCKTALEKGLTPCSTVDVSATKIREKMQKNESVSGLVPKSIESLFYFPNR